MNKEEIEEIETLEIDFKDTDELELALEVSSKKAIYLIDDLIKHLFELQQENKQLKDNWDKLKEWSKEYEEGTYGLGSYETGLSDGLGDVIKKMRELQGSDSNE